MRALVSIIIVNWNGLQWLKLCLPSLKKQQYSPVEIILVDNASTDDSIEWTYKNYPLVKIHKNAKNLGFAEANNIGYREAKGEYVLFLNNDTTVCSDFLVELVLKIESNPDIAGAQSKLLLMDDHARLDAVGAFLTPTGFLFHWGFGQLDRKKYDKTENLYTTKGASMMYRRDVLKEVEIQNCIFDPTYFAYFEESDLCHRVWLTGKRIVYAPRSVVYHKMGGTSTGMNNAFIQYHSFKNRIRTYAKNLEWENLIKLMPVHLAMCEFFSLTSLFCGNAALSWAIQRAFWWNIRNISSTLQDRAYIQSTIRKVSDKEIFSQVMRRPGINYYFSLSKGRTSDET